MLSERSTLEKQLPLPLDTWNKISPFIIENKCSTVLQVKSPSLSFCYNFYTNTLTRLKINKKITALNSACTEGSFIATHKHLIALIELYLGGSTGFKGKDYAFCLNWLLRYFPSRSNSMIHKKMIINLLLLDILNTHREVVQDCFLLPLVQDYFRGISTFSTWASTLVLYSGGQITTQFYDVNLGIPNRFLRENLFNNNLSFWFPNTVPEAVRITRIKGRPGLSLDPVEIGKRTRHGKTSIIYTDLVPRLYANTHITKAVKCEHLEYKGKALYGLCQDCFSSLSKTGKLINDYSTKVPHYIKSQFGERKGKYSWAPTLYGVELELENGKEEAAIPLYSKLGDFLICKNDSSLASGFEIVTCPATFDIHKEKGKILFETITKETKLESKDSCGLHIHVSKNSLSTLQVGKIVAFIHNPKNKDFIINIAGRNNERFASINAERGITDVAPENFNLSMEQRYSGVNLRNENTIEFRIFASTVILSTYMVRFEFVKALVDYTSPGKINVKSLAEGKEKDTFISFLSSEKKEYPNLCDYLGLIKPRDGKEKYSSSQKKEIK